MKPPTKKYKDVRIRSPDRPKIRPKTKRKMPPILMLSNKASMKAALITLCPKREAAPESDFATNLPTSFPVL